MGDGSGNLRDTIWIGREERVGVSRCPFPQSVRKGNGKQLVHCGLAVRCAGDATGSFKSAQGGRERLVAHVQSCAQGAMGGGAGAAQVSDDALSEGHGGGWRRRRRDRRVAELGSGRKGLAVAGEFGVVLQFEANQRGLASAGVIGGQQMERQRRWRGCSTMLDGESQAVGPAGEIEVGIAPGPEVTTAAQRLAGKGGAALAGMVDEEDGGVEGACQFTQCGENGGDLACVILILCDYHSYVTTDPLLPDKCSIATELRV